MQKKNKKNYQLIHIHVFLIKICPYYLKFFIISNIPDRHEQDSNIILHLFYQILYFGCIEMDKDDFLHF